MTPTDAAPVTEAGKRLLSEIEDSIEMEARADFAARLVEKVKALPGWEWDNDAGNNYLHRSAVLALIESEAGK